MFGCLRILVSIEEERAYSLSRFEARGGGQSPGVHRMKVI